ncbi:MAG: hypothetical protein NUV77_02770 [Thermoguttaceae bacterium]|nr:hypothetical protein [Thermoguttaceae bacterium]
MTAVWWGCLILTAGMALGADEIRYFEHNGITYRETRRTIDQAAPQVRYQDCQQTYYREQVVQETREVVRTWWTPVTEYRWETYWVNRWNPFAEPYQAARYVPHTRWERRTEVVQVPVVCRRLVPETQVVRVPVGAWCNSPQEVVTRVAVSGIPSSAASRSIPGVPTVASTSSIASSRPSAPTAQTMFPSPVAQSSSRMVPVTIPGLPRSEGIGGLGRLGDEPPRYGQRPAWEPTR